MIDKDTLKLLRIPFSFFLMPVFLFALSQAGSGMNILNAVVCFIVLHIFIYPASNGYNSYMDQDEGSIGGLKNPPRATKKLFYASLLFDASGLALSLIISLHFFIYVVLYILASRAYSYKGIRLKKLPFTGFLTVAFFQGAFTFVMVYSAVTDTSLSGLLNSNLIYAAAASTFLIGGVYPLTQIYQHKADAENGDITISYKLGYKGTFIFTIIMFIIANLLLLQYFYTSGQISRFYVFQVMLLPVIVVFLTWFIKVIKDTKNADFEHTMRMNTIASCCMNACFLVLLFLN